MAATRPDPRDEFLRLSPASPISTLGPIKSVLPILASESLPDLLQTESPPSTVAIANEVGKVRPGYPENLFNKKTSIAISEKRSTFYIIYSNYATITCSTEINSNGLVNLEAAQ